MDSIVLTKRPKIQSESEQDEEVCSLASKDDEIDDSSYNTQEDAFESQFSRKFVKYI